jgi:arylsulfatase A-like enzyme
LAVFDTVRSDHLGVYGHSLPTSPGIDALASESVRFERAFSHSTWTKPSIATLMTSVYPVEHGIRRVGIEDGKVVRTDRLRGAYRTLAEHFRKSGYRTAAVGANVHIQRKTGFAQGFDHFISTRLLTAFEINSELRSWFESGEDRPFFVYAHYMDAHWPYTRRLEEEEEGRFGSTQYERDPPENWRGVAKWARQYLNEESLETLRVNYDEEIAFADRAFEELIGWLKETRRYDDTVVVVTSDHGEGFFEHGELQHGFEPYDEVTSIPLLIRLPDRYEVEPKSIDSVVGLIDVMPTLLDLADLRLPAVAEGRSLVPLLTEESFPERPVYVEGREIIGMRNRSHKLLVATDGSVECFALNSDPGESQPISTDLPDECRELGQDLDRLQSRLEKKERVGGSNTEVALEPEEIEALKSLGYLGD